MGCNLKDLLIYKEIDFDFLRGKILTVDSYNVLYQFLSTIRQRDGSLLKDSDGNITSHLTGLFARTTNLMQKGIKLAFVFDGKAPDLKKREREKRRSAKLEAQDKFNKAEKSGDLKNMKKFASRTSRLTSDMVDETKELIKNLGLPVIQAPSEGEAQASFIVKENKAFAAVSEDYDSLLYNVPRLVKNLTLSGRRKIRASYITIKPKIISTTENLNNLGIDQNQLICLSLLVGTDYNPGGIKGIGPKNAIKLIKEYKDDFDSLFKKVKWDDDFDFDWKVAYDTIKKMPVTKDYSLEWASPDIEKIKELLIEKHDFSEERVNNTLEKINSIESKNSQKGLNEWF